MRVHDKLVRDDINFLMMEINKVMSVEKDDIFFEKLSFFYCCLSVIFAISKDGNIEQLSDSRVDLQLRRIAKICDEKFLSSLNISYNSFFIICSIMLLGRFFDKYFIVRNRLSALIKDSYKEGSEELESSMVYFSCLAEDPKKYGDYLLNLYSSLKDEMKISMRPQMRAVLLLAKGQESYKKRSAVTISDPIDKDFELLVNKKSIAIVGPIDVGLNNGIEIDSFDLVIRFNHSGKAVYDKEIFGTRTDISYYTNQAFTKIVHNDPAETLEDLKFAVLQRLSDNNIPLALDKYLCKFRAQYRRSNAIFFKSHGNAVQRLILDLVRFDISRLKLFNMNLWLTPHNEKYLARRNSLDAHTFIHHDAITNFVFLKNVFEKKIFEVDDELSKVLSLNKEDYIQNLHSRYGFNIEY